MTHPGCADVGCVMASVGAWDIVMTGLTEIGWVDFLLAWAVLSTALRLNLLVPGTAVNENRAGVPLVTTPASLRVIAFVVGSGFTIDSAPVWPATTAAFSFGLVFPVVTGALHNGPPGRLTH